jgi:Zn-dependent peptidase ImmA (M78 family)
MAHAPALDSFSGVLPVIRDLIRETGLVREGNFPVPCKAYLPYICKVAAAFRQVAPAAYPIDIKCHSWAGDQIYSALLRRKNGARILFAENLNACHARFVVFKELAHLLLDHDEHFKASTAFSENIDVFEAFLKFEVERFSTPLESERMAVLFAIEMIIPWPCRKIFDDMCDADKSDHDIAEAFKIPEKFVTKFRESDFRKISALTHSQLDEVDAKLGRLSIAPGR